MSLKDLIFRAKKEQRVIEKMRTHMSLLCSATESLHLALQNDNRVAMRSMPEFEREADSIRREITSKIYEGAFLPYLRPDLCRFVEIVDQVFDLLKDVAVNYLDSDIPEALRNECARVAFLNSEMCQMLMLTFNAMLKGDDLRKKTLAVRIYEKKIDDIKESLFRDLRKIPVDNFWEGEILSQFLTSLTSVSDIIEDATDHLQIINVSMK